NVRRLDVLVDQTPAMELAQSGTQAHRGPQELSELGRLREQTTQRLSARVLEHEGGSVVVAGEQDWPDRPGAVQVCPQRVFVLEPTNELRCWMLRHRCQRQNGDRPRSARVPLRPSREHEVRVGANWVEGVLRKTHGPPSSGGVLEMSPPSPQT